MINDTQHESTLRDLLRIIFKYKLIILTGFLTIMIAVYIGLELRTPMHRSIVKMLVTGTMQKGLEVQRSLGPGSLLETQMSLVRGIPIIARTVEALKLYQRPLDYERRYATRVKRVLIDHNVRKLKSEIDAMALEEKRTFFFNKAMGQLIGNISMFPEGKTSIFYIQVTDYNAGAAATIANVISRSYVIFDLEQQIAELQLIYGGKNDAIIKLEKYIEDLQETLDGRIMSDIEAMGPASVKIISQAGPGTKIRMKPSKSGGLMAGFVLSIIVGVSLAFIFDFFDQTFKTRDDVGKYLNLLYLGSIPKRKSSDKLLTNSNNPDTRYSQLMQSCSNRLYLSMKDQGFKSILLTDAEGSKETAFIAANLAICLSSKSDYRVLIIDANFRSPSLHREFNIPDAPGLKDVIEGKINFENVIHDVGHNLSVITVGDSVLNPIALLESNKMSYMIQKAKELFDVIFVNCSEINKYSDAVIISSCIDSIAIVINEGMVRKQIVKNAIAPLELRKIPIMGVILNNHKYVIPEIIYRLT